MFGTLNFSKSIVNYAFPSSSCFDSWRERGTTYADSSDSSDQIKILRFTLVALVLSIVWLIFNPIWFPQAKLKYDFGRIFLLFVALLAATIAYLTYKRRLRGQ